MSGTDPDLRPTWASAGAAVALSLAAVAVVATSDVTSALGAEVVGLVFLAGGATLGYRGRRVVGSALTLAGVGIVVGAVALVWVATTDLLALVQFVPGMLGTAIVVAGVFPVRQGGSRQLVKIGTALVFVTVIGAGVVQQPSLVTLLGAGVLTVLSWDVGENAIGLGAQVGRRAGTARAEAVHLAGTTLVGAVAVGAGQFAVGLGSPGVPIGAFAVLVTGLVLLAGALHG